MPSILYDKQAKPFKLCLLLWLAMLTSCLPSSKIDPEVYNAFEAVGLIQGQHYSLTDKPLVNLPLPASAEISVIEFFWYGCSHCLKLESPIIQWSANLPDSIHFQKIPAVWSDAMQYHAKAFFIAESLGQSRIKSQLFPLVLSFQDIQEDLNEQKSRIKNYFASFYFAPEDFDAAWESDEMQQKLKQASLWQKQSGMLGTPSIVVDGKYLLNNRELSKPQQLIDATNKMIEALQMLKQTADH